ncbi:DNA polymerase I [Leisingera sp. NJS204]|uniref:DNA polymerase I n=1 Tax=Leisingera sp. NJS204 TaxID=2508307 RepID=UPI00101348FD|nr:DNA polymerase I [Leisingera sp. NJS204]QAX31290.1 DNA polymerase I [Leisingera sp. NJS204]
MLYIDVETFNAEKDISAGTYEYARTAEILLVTYAIGGGPVKLWDVTEGDKMPEELADALLDETVPITAHNAMFDRRVLAANFGPADTIVGNPARWRCTMVKAMTHGFPGSLDQLGQILRLSPDQAKLKEGKKLINRFCKPAPKNHKADRYDRTTHPEEWAQFCDYAVRDIGSMREIDRRLPDWNYRGDELEMYRLDQRINDRGFQCDRALVEAGVRAAREEKETLSARFIELTGGAVERPTMRAKFLEFLNEEFNLDLDNTRSQTFKDFLAAPDREVRPELRELMEISIMSNKTSTAKYGALEPAISPDGRFRGGLQFSGAARTRRWAGRTFQPHNLPSRGLPPQSAVDQYIAALKAGVQDLLFDDLMLFGSAALRGVVEAPEGKQLTVADLSNIEGRANAWLAGEHWKLEAFEAFDAGTGPDLYNVTAGSLLGQDPYEVSKSDRNVMGKVPELALGYQGGVGAFQTFAQTYGVQMADHWGTIRVNMPRFADKAKENYHVWGKQRDPDLDPVEWIASETVKLAWRQRHPAIADLWKACETAAREALKKPGKAFRAGPHMVFKRVTHAGHNYLLNRLPSGKFLVYFSPRLDPQGRITHRGVDPITRQWVRQHTYGGKLVENACQSLSRDILAHNMPACEAAGFEILLTVHDETVTEAPIDENRSADALAAIMATPPEWAPGFPLAAAGFVADRYRKD